MKAKMVYTGIRVKDLEESIKFYTQVMGMMVRGRSKIPAARGEVVDLVSDEGGPVLELNYYEKGSRFDTEYIVGEGLDHLAFKVDNLDRALAEANNAGYPLAFEIKGETSRWAYIHDPNGILIELCLNEL